ncbi:MAG: hypothetical protein IKV87_03170 [Methanobrevibacter sp.]|nr:hypothetical protein [Methanobrevibacter sp.]
MLMIDEFRKEMEKPKEIYTKELEKYVKRYSFLGEFTIVEEPDIDTADYFFCFKNLNGTSKEILKLATSEIYNHMVRFSKANGIDEFSKNAHIYIES